VVATAPEEALMEKIENVKEMYYKIICLHLT